MASCVKLPVPSGVCSNSKLIHDVTVSGIHLVHQRSGRDFDGAADRADLQGGIDGGSAVGINQHLGVRFGLETLLGEAELVHADGQVWNRIGAV